MGSVSDKVMIKMLGVDVVGQKRRRNVGCLGCQGEDDDGAAMLLQ